MPGIEVAIVRRDAEGRPITDGNGEPVLEDRPFTEGELAIRVPWPSMFRAYLGADDRYRKSFLGNWYLFLSTQG